VSTRELSSWERMTTEIVQFIQTRHIDSFQKLRVLIFFHEHADSSWTSLQIAARLYLGDGPLLEKIIADLQAAGLVDCVARHCRLREEAGIRLGLQHLVKTCENPLARQEILDSVRRRALASYRQQEGVYETY
jgi:hypothetical protein